ncbi:hypothetical protein [Roseimaritima ulvae]|uniref:Uncharacterized protein n=1 Tax=Roseimaritima ulvae TaxID=980254 RepID=A0A5B9QSJ9_9BACT|nr:hypothetical protein [Roseimaritima ulvae]QEG42097.1 hypothetical protein UC8_41290 [Roseimaritima ulvae]
MLRQISWLAVVLAIAGCNSRVDEFEAPEQFMFASVEMEIKHATIYGVLNTPEWSRFNGQLDRIEWYVEIVGAKPRRIRTPFRISFNSVSDGVDSWQDLESVDINWTDPTNPLTGTPNALVEAVQPQWAQASTRQIVARDGFVRVVARNGAKFRVVAEGTTDSSVPFSLNATFEFTGITVHGAGADDEQTLSRRLESELPGHDLVLERVERKENENPAVTFAHFIPQAKLGI